MILNFGYIYMELQMNLSDSLKFPCSITSDTGYITSGGSAINQIIAAARCGAKTSLIGSIGNDTFGKTILNTLRREGIQTSGIAKCELPTAIINSIINDKGEKASIIMQGANSSISTGQIPDNSLNEKTLILLQNDITLDVNINILKRAKQGASRSIMCLEHGGNIDTSLFDLLDIAIVNDQVSMPKTKDTRIITIKHKDRAFDAFCGSFAACVQAGVNLERAMKYGHLAAELTSKNSSFPYLCDIEDTALTLAKP